MLNYEVDSPAGCMGTNCTPVLDIYRMSRNFFRHLKKTKKIKETRLLNFVYRYISINKQIFSDWVPFIYPSENKFQETTDTASFKSVLDVDL